MVTASITASIQSQRLQRSPMTPRYAILRLVAGEPDTSQLAHGLPLVPSSCEHGAALWSGSRSNGGAQVETGNPYMLYKDNCNRKSNQQNLVRPVVFLCVSGSGPVPHCIIAARRACPVAICLWR